MIWRFCEITVWHIVLRVSKSALAASFVSCSISIGSSFHLPKMSLQHFLLMKRQQGFGSRPKGGGQHGCHVIGALPLGIKGSDSSARPAARPWQMDATGSRTFAWGAGPPSAGAWEAPASADDASQIVGRSSGVPSTRPQFPGGVRATDHAASTNIRQHGAGRTRISISELGERGVQ